MSDNKAIYNQYFSGSCTPFQVSNYVKELEQQKEELIEFIQHLYVNYHLPYGAMDIQTKKKFEEIKNKYK